jgi:hypothetical protein
MRIVVPRLVTGAIVVVLVASFVLPHPAAARKHRRHRRAHRAGALAVTSLPCGEGPDDATQVSAVRAAADAQCDCAGAADHTSYVSCVSGVTRSAVRDGRLRPECFTPVVGCASNSTCGKEGAVTCCMT